MQYYGTTEVDASLLQLPQIGFLEPDDPRMLGTVAAIENDLLRDGLLLRYRTETDVDGLPGGEHPFLACSFWLAHQYAHSGRVDDATALLDRLVGFCNDVGLLSEEYDVAGARQMGNTPQALSHLALVGAADALASVTGERPGAGEPVLYRAASAGRSAAAVPRCARTPGSPGQFCSSLRQVASRSASGTRVARTGTRRPRMLTAASGCFSRFAVHAGWFSRAKLLPVTSMSSPSGQYMSAVSRGSPVFAPVVWSTSDGTPSPLSGMRPRETTRHARSSGGMIRGPAARKARVRETHATGGRSTRGRAMRPSCRVEREYPGAGIRSHEHEEDRIPVVRALAGRAGIAGAAPAQDALLQTIELAVAAEEVGVAGAFVRVHHFARQLASPFPLLAAMGARTSTIELGTAVIDMRYENPLYMAEEAAAADLISGGRLQLGISRGSPEPALDGAASFGYVPAEGETDADMARAHTEVFRMAIAGTAVARGNPQMGAVGGLAIQPQSPGLPDRIWWGAGTRATAVWTAEQGMNLMSSTLLTEDTGVPFDELQAEQIAMFRDAWKTAGHEREPRVSVSRSILPLIDDETRHYFGLRAQADSSDQVGHIGT